MLLLADATNPLNITIAGVIIALLFLSSIVGTLAWMLRLPKESEQRRTATRAVRSVNKLTRILKARHAGSAIVHEAEKQCADLILMANVPVRVRGNLQQIDPAIDYVMKNAPCEVLVLSQGNLTFSRASGFASQII